MKILGFLLTTQIHAELSQNILTKCIFFVVVRNSSNNCKEVKIVHAEKRLAVAQLRDYAVNHEPSMAAQNPGDSRQLEWEAARWTIDQCSSPGAWRFMAVGGQLSRGKLVTQPGSPGSQLSGGGSSTKPSSSGIQRTQPGSLGAQLRDGTEWQWISNPAQQPKSSPRSPDEQWQMGSKPKTLPSSPAA